ncbi:TlpA family protein disulfide reductase [Nitrospina watsonii]|uniref:Alkyl hydroperoxide reductase/ Thiol specific antioxidant/ Mal allergen n=1 Tax=Nitrospina watsonii TaxID=1323948 RepID=A0ABM9HDP6_9BACT|nr:hypothetical protein [Nitrospina watsonii]CAI2718318.1 Alkyl hydroperoxide reductase/ Thiol specific antioxidant/ Mal allergen [Nitrospina watsonii]
MSQVDQPAPNLDVAEWVQGEASNIDHERGNVILILVFQVNCPGCFVGGFPEVIEVHQKFRGRPLKVWGLATAFEDHSLNNLENVKRLVHRGEVVGATLSYLQQANLLQAGRLSFPIPFPIAWDRVVKREGEVTAEEIENFLVRDFPNHEAMPGHMVNQVKSQVKNYLARKQYDAKTFDQYALQGTPSSILIDKQGILRHKLFGSSLRLDGYVEPLLDE